MLRNFRRLVFFLLLIGALAAFGKNGLKAAVGGFAKFAVKTLAASRLAYRSLEWEEGKLIFLDPVFFDVEGDQRKYHARAERVEVAFSFDQFPSRLGLVIQVDKPHVTLFASPKSVKIGSSDWLDLRLKLVNGFLDWPAMGLQAKMMLEKTSPRQLGRILLEFGSSKVQIEALREEAGMRFEFAFSEFDARLLQPWIDWASYDFYLENGLLNGWIHLESLKNEWIRGSAHGEGKNISLQGRLGSIQAGNSSFDWDGEFKMADNLLFAKAAPVGRFRFEWESLSLSAHHRGIEEAKGSFSYHSDLGFRGEWDGIGWADQDRFPVSFAVKGFWPSHSNSWLDAELHFPKGRCDLKGKADAKERHWTLEIRDLQPPWAHLLQEIASIQMPICKEWTWKEGEVSCIANGVFSNQELVQWKIDLSEAKQIVICSRGEEDTHFGCASLVAQLSSEGWKGGFTLEGFHARFGSGEGRDICAWDWSASGTLADGRVAASRWRGQLNGRGCEGSFSGGADWKLEGICEEYQFGLQGAWKNRILSFDSSRIQGGGLSWCGSGWVDFSDAARLPFAISTQRFRCGLGVIFEGIHSSQRNKDPSQESLFEFASRLYLEQERRHDGRAKSCPIDSEERLKGVEAAEMREAQLLSAEQQSEYELGQRDRFGKVASTQNLPLGIKEGSIVSDRFFCQGNLRDPISLWDWELAAVLEGGALLLPSGIRLERAKGRLVASPQDWVCEDASADLIVSGQKLCLESTQFMKEGDTIHFDVRLRRGFWDLARLVGSQREGVIAFDQKRTELLGNPVSIKECLCQEGRFEKLSLNLNLPWASVLSLGPMLEEAGIKIPTLSKAPLSGSAAVCFTYLNGEKIEAAVEGIDLFWNEAPLPFSFRAERSENLWRVNGIRFGDFTLSFSMFFDNGWWMLKEGMGACQDRALCTFHGKLDAQGKGQVALSEFKAEAAPLLSLFSAPSEIWGGTVKGQGCVTFDLSTWDYETDFDLGSIDLKAGPFHLENRGPIHAFFSPTQGLIFQGVDFHAEQENQPSINFKIGLMQFDAIRSTWVLNHAHVHLPGNLFPSILKGLDPDHDIDFIADIQCASDFSTLSCYLKEGFVSFGGVLRHLQDLRLHWDEKHILSDFCYFHQSHCLKIGLHIDRGPILEGRLTLEDVEHPLLEGERPLAIDWEYEDHFGTAVHSIEGNFGGVEASFHAELIDSKSHLIGSARIHFGLLSELLPPSVAEVFTELEMGKGYELKGRLHIDRRDLSQIFFNGILSGKQLELFGYQLRTLLAQVDLSPDKMKIYDLKISDSAGILKIDEMLMGGEKNHPWTVSIPLITISELRPSLLQKPGGPPGEISPLVVREMKIRDFRGILEDGNTYTAHGELHFINSYKRGHTVFDLPSDVLGRIIGLDMELLIPVCGTLRYVLKDGAFRINELEDAYSEGRRSQFFLVHTDESPTLDLDGNLQIHVKMKQFVLFKLTEAFVISIDGKLNNPHYHLQKKKRFLGL